MFGKMQWMLEGLTTYPAKMEQNLWRTRGLIFSSKVLLALVDTGISREDAYVIVQRNAMQVVGGTSKRRVGSDEYRERLEADPAASVLTAEKLDEIFDPWDFLTRKGAVFEHLETLASARAWTLAVSRGLTKEGRLPPLRFSINGPRVFSRPVSCVRGFCFYPAVPVVQDAPPPCAALIAGSAFDLLREGGGGLNARHERGCDSGVVNSSSRASRSSRSFFTESSLLPRTGDSAARRRKAPPALRVRSRRGR